MNPWTNPPKQPVPQVHLSCPNLELNLEYSKVLKQIEQFQTRWRRFAACMDLDVAFTPKRMFGSKVLRLTPTHSNPNADYYKHGGTMVWEPRTTTPKGGSKAQLAEVVAATAEYTLHCFGQTTAPYFSTEESKLVSLLGNPNVLHWCDCSAIYQHPDSGLITFYGEEQSIRAYMAKLGFTLDVAEPHWSN